jgi:hypothetical protein
MMSRNEFLRMSFPLQSAMQPALEPLLMTEAEFTELKFAHHVTHSRVDATTGCRAGTTVWVGATIAGRCAALSFDFVEDRSGSLMVRDPLNTQSNAYLIDAAALEDKGFRLRALLIAVNRIPWAKRVAEELPAAVS